MNPETQIDNDEMLPEYDFSGGVRGKYYEAYKQAQNISQNTIVLDPDVASVFRDSASVNEALRMLLKIASSMKTIPINQDPPLVNS
ncbi:MULTISPECIES: hypothetical protein [Pseudanabaena]|jgi:hypothetical protein|uniref:Uncharacterized protein n=2 Tax=Pseudanabaena TaxID=1152 RepID=L8N679_9CYAN|nr:MULTISPECIES: hypothetical protein [Pseudanabaena]ELS34639.1 hypothetical protein Pse7429DRAFT_0181 [Pseudanabaena biceps PCC 7429]MDG3493162.1 hypothetical protein [Pseudanabaena catenata USMAC16]